MGFRNEQITVAALEKRLKELGGAQTDINSPNGEKFQLHFLMLQAVRLRQGEVHGTHGSVCWPCQLGAVGGAVGGILRPLASPAPHQPRLCPSRPALRAR